MKQFGRPTKWQNAALFAERCEAYFTKVKEEGTLPTLTGLSLMLEVSDDTLRNYEEKPRFKPILKRCRAVIEEAWVQAARTEKGSKQIFAIFYLKAKHGWRDSQDLNISGGLSLSQLFDKAKNKQ